MKRKVKRYDEGGILTDRYGNAVRSSSGEPVKTRYGSAKEDRPKAGADDYATMGKRAGVTSPFLKENITESITEDTEKESPKGIASGFKSGESKFERNDNEVRMPKPKAKPKPRYSGVVSSEDLGSQDFSSKGKSSAPSSDVSAPGGKMLDRNSRDFAGVKSASGNSWLTPPKYGANKISDEEAAQLEKKRSVANAKKMAASTPDNRSKSGTSLRMPGSNMDMNDPSSMTLGSDLDPKSMMMRNRRVSGDMDFKKGGQTKKMASGGKTSSASSRGDGIAQRGKTRGRIC